MKDSKHKNSKATRTRNGEVIEWNGWYVSEEYDTIEELREALIGLGSDPEDVDKEIEDGFKGETWYRWRNGKIQCASEGSYTTEEEW